MLDKVGSIEPPKVVLPETADLRRYCPLVENQGSLGSCTANAGVRLVEYFERRAFGKHVDASRRFLYKTTRHLMQTTRDTGVYIRTTMTVLVLFGDLPEKYFPYFIAEFDEEPLHHVPLDFTGERRRQDSLSLLRGRCAWRSCCNSRGI